MKRIVCVALAFMMLSCLLVISPNETHAASALSAGLSFDATSKYCFDKPLPQIPTTIEATILLPADFSDSGHAGVILGNYNGDAGSLNLEVVPGGKLRYYVIDKNGTVFDYTFQEVDLRTGRWTQIALVRDMEAHKLLLYIDGNFVQALDTAETESSLNDSKFVLGGDGRANNSAYFKGRILNVALYSDIRTPAEIKKDTAGFGLTEIILCCDLSSNSGDNKPYVFSDIAGNGYSLILDGVWQDEAPKIGPYDFAIAFVPDTQVVTYYYPDKLTCIYDWLVENAESKKIQFVVGLGDITEKNKDYEWELAKEQISKLNGVIRYSLIRGNHDKSPKYNKYFPYEEFENMGGSFDGTSNNTWQEINMGGLDYLFMGLDYGAPDDVLQWASDVIKAHPNHNVIISTHCYLFRDGTTLDDRDDTPPSGDGEQFNDGDDMWEKLVSQHENIIMVASGHDPSDYIVVTQTPGIHGNIVTQMLIDAQSVDLSMKGTGMVAMAYFSNGGKTVQMEYYSTIRNQWYLKENSFTMEVNAVTPPTPPAAPVEEQPTQDWLPINIAVASGIVAILIIPVTAFIIAKNKKEKV